MKSEQSGERGAAYSKAYRRYQYASSSLSQFKKWTRWPPVFFSTLTFAELIPVPLGMSPDDPFRSMATVLAMTLSVGVLLGMYVGMLVSRRLLATVSYAIESGKLVVRGLGNLRLTEIDLATISRVCVGSTQRPDTLRVHLRCAKRRQHVILTLVDMAEFIAEIERHTHVSVDYTEDTLLTWTRNQIVFGTILVAVLIGGTAIRFVSAFV